MRPTRCSASQATASTSRWLVGSSSTIRSWWPSSSAARAQRRRSPPDSPRTGRSSEIPASSSSTTSRMRRVGRPLVVGEPAEHGLADRVGVDELVALVQVADLDAAGHRDPAGVGLLEAGHHLEQGGLAVAVATDDADPLPRRDAEGDLVEQRAHAVGLGDPLEVDQVGCDAHPVLTLIWLSHPSTSRSSDLDDLGTGDRPGRTSTTAWPDARSAPARAWARWATRPGTGRSGRTRRRARARRPRTRRGRGGRRGRDAGRAPAPAGRCAARRRAGAGRRSPGPRAARPRTPARRPRRGTARRSVGRPPAWRARRAPDGTTTHHHGPLSATDVTSSPRPVPSAVPPIRAKGTSLPSSAAIASSSSSGVRASHNRSRASRAAAASAEPPAMPPATGISLWTRKSTTGSRPTRCGHQRRRAGDDVVLADRHVGHVDVLGPVGHHAERVALGGHELVVQARSPGRRSRAGGSRPRGRHRHRGGG